MTPILSQINPVLTLSSCLTFFLILSYHFRSCLPCGLFLFCHRQCRKCLPSQFAYFHRPEQYLARSTSRGRSSLSCSLFWNSESVFCPQRDGATSIHSVGDMPWSVHLQWHARIIQCVQLKSHSAHTISNPAHRVCVYSLIQGVFFLIAGLFVQWHACIIQCVRLKSHSAHTISNPVHRVCVYSLCYTGCVF